MTLIKSFAPLFLFLNIFSGLMGIKAFAPASVGNIGIGFDILGLAIEQPGDEVIASKSNIPGLRITKITGASGKLPYAPEQNTAGVAVLHLLQHLGETGRGIELEIHKKMPINSGLGSSAASGRGTKSLTVCSTLLS